MDNGTSKYQLKQIQCRPWTLSGLSLKLIESHYENNYGGALRRLNAITEQLEKLDFATAPGFVINGLKREELIALNSTLLHELYFASMGGDGRVNKAMSEALARDFGSVQRWRAQFSAMGYALGGGSGWVLLTWMPRDGRLIRPQPGGRGRRAEPRARHVRARVSHRLRCERQGLRRHVHAQPRLGRGRRTL
jgi:Fe-Mn family superoxide dismutase